MAHIKISTSEPAYRTSGSGGTELPVPPAPEYCLALGSSGLGERDIRFRG